MGFVSMARRHAIDRNSPLAFSSYNVDDIAPHLVTNARANPALPKGCSHLLDPRIDEFRVGQQVGQWVRPTGEQLSPPWERKTIASLAFIFSTQILTLC